MAIVVRVRIAALDLPIAIMIADVVADGAPVFLCFACAGRAVALRALRFFGGFPRLRNSSRTVGDFASRSRAYRAEIWLCALSGCEHCILWRRVASSGARLSRGTDD